MKKKRFPLLISLLLLLGLSAGCDILQSDPTLTPIYVTATPEFIIVTNTFTPSPSPVLAPTVDLGGGGATQDPNSEVTAQATQAQPSPSPTTLITNTPTFTPTPTNTAVIRGVPLYMPVGMDPDSIDEAQIGFVTGNCVATPQGGFAAIYNSDPNLAAQLSCPVSSATSISSAYQSYERGLMVWVASQGVPPQSAIFAFYSNGTYQTFADTWRDGIDPSSTGAQPPSGGLLEPIRGFGKVWRESGGVRDTIGWATTNESGGNATIQQFERGTMLYLPQTNQTYIMLTGAPGTWVSKAVPF